jgi:prepilin-type N-terminal cleavage/methylation domain-containing protein
MHTTHRGFTLIEIMVASAVFAIFMVGILNLLDTSTKISVVETELSDTQENVRFAAYHIMRTARMMGSAMMPVAADVTGTPTWFAGSLDSDQSTSFTTPFGAVAVVDGSDVLTLRGFFEVAPFFTDRTDISAGPPYQVLVRESESPGGLVINDNFDSVDAATLEGRGLFFSGNIDQGEYAVGQIGNGSTMTGTATDRFLAIKYAGGSSQWSGLNRDGATMTIPPAFNVFRVAVFDSYTYYVRPDFTLMRMRADGSAGGATPQPVAVNIGSLQVAFGLDTSTPADGLVDTWAAAPTAADVVAANNRVVAMRITVLGRTPRAVPDWNEPVATFTVEDMDITDIDREHKWRRIQVVAALRNYLF